MPIVLRDSYKTETHYMLGLELYRGHEWNDPNADLDKLKNNFFRLISLLSIYASKTETHPICMAYSQIPLLWVRAKIG